MVLVPTHGADYAVARYAFEASTSDEVTLIEGDSYEILEEDSSGWWKVKNKAGQIGMAPSNYMDVKKGEPTGETTVAWTASGN